MNIKSLLLRAGSLGLIIFTVMIAFEIPASAQTQSPLTLGEFLVYVENPSDSLYITADASGAVGGNWCDWYPITHDYDHRSITYASLRLMHLNRSNHCPGYTGTGYFAYGAYVVTIEGHSIVMDYRDADYQDGGGQNGFGTDYSSADVYAYYNQADGNFYKNLWTH
jgi:hypothetical protein